MCPRPCGRIIEAMATIAPARDPRTDAVAATEAIIVDHLRKRYGATTVLDDISFTVRPGELFGLLGTNGAGKTTAVEILQGLRPRDGGSVEVLGLDPGRSGGRLRRLIGAQLQASSLPDRLRVGEAVRFFSSLHPTARPIGELAEDWALGPLWNRPFGALSGGERQRLFVALALVGRPRVVFLDELTQNLDPAGRRRTWEIIRRVRDGGTTVVLVTHDVEEAERLCDRLVVLHGGRVVAEGTPAAIVERLGGATAVTFTDPDLDLRAVRRVPGVSGVSRQGPEVRVEGRGPFVANLGARLVALHRCPEDLRTHHPTLEDHFVSLTEGTPS